MGVLVVALSVVLLFGIRLDSKTLRLRLSVAVFRSRFVIMATQRVAYDHARLVALAEEATASTSLKGFDLACKYVQEDVAISWNTKARFQWSARTSEYERVEEVRVKAENANYN